MSSWITRIPFIFAFALDNPWFAAQQFLEKNQLSQMFLDQVANFIINNTKSIAIGPQTDQSSYVDPFTGGSRYIPGASTTNETSDVGRVGADPFTGKLFFLNFVLCGIARFGEKIRLNFHLQSENICIICFEL